MRTSQPARPVLDGEHLSRQTFGDRDLERELLALFEQQCLRLLPILAGADRPVERGDAAHALKGAAGAVGAFRIAGLAAALERALDEGRAPRTVTRLLATLDAAIRDVRPAIAARWRDAA